MKLATEILIWICIILMIAHSMSGDLETFILIPLLILIVKFRTKLDE